jgi:nicotinate phosphoribosyltransferase
MTADFNDPGLIDAAAAALLTDQYELTMAASYLRRDRNDEATFELFVRDLPPNRAWLLAAGIGPTLRLVRELRFERPALDYLASLGRFDDAFLDYLETFRFAGDIEAIPEGTVCFGGEPLVRITAPRIEAQLLETILLNQIGFQTLVATKAARVVLAAGGGELGAGERVVDFSPRRDHGIDAALKVARAAAVAGCGGTSNMLAAMLYGLQPVGTMAHSYVLSFDSEPEAFRAFVEDHPEATILLVDTYDTLTGVRNAIAAAREAGKPLAGVRLDSGDLDALSRSTRRLLDEAGLQTTQIAASGDLEEEQISRLVAAGAPIDLWGVGTELGTSRDAPSLNVVYKLVADRRGGAWRGVRKLSAAKATLPGRKQVWRRHRDGEMASDIVGLEHEDVPGEPLLVPAMRSGERLPAQTLEEIRARSAAQLAALPAPLRRFGGDAAADPYPVDLSPGLRELAGAGA